MKFPTRGIGLATIDFETYYADTYTLTKMTTESYIRDPRFEVIGVGVKIGEVSKWMTEAEFRAFAPKLRGMAVLAHHAHFDGLILNHRFGVKPAFWFDTLSMARHVHGTEVGNSLKKLAEHYGVGVKGEEVILARGLHLADFPPAQLTQYGNYCLNDCALTEAIFWKMTEAFPASFSDIELWSIDATVRMFTEPSAILDAEKLEKALAEEVQKKADLLARAETTKVDLLSAPKFAALLMELGVEPPTKVSLKTGKETFAFAKSDPGFKDLLESDRDEVRWLAEARVGIKSTINETRTARLLGMAHRGKAAVYLKMYGAHTGRWSGGDKSNFQNLRRGGILRDSVTAPENHVIVACDSAQIEARGLAWLANDVELLQAFRENRDVYSELASEIYGRHVDRKKNKDDEVPGFVGKVATLGLGYGMGWKKFAGTLLAGAIGGPPVQFTASDAANMWVNVPDFKARNAEALETIISRLNPEDLATHCAVAKAIVDKYRKVRKPIKDFWNTASEAIGWMESPDHGQAATHWGPSQLFVAERHRMRLPSGNVLNYPGLRGTAEGYSYLGGRAKNERTRIYGGSLTENLVQAFCRDIIAEQMACLYAEYGYRPLTMTHDEIVFLAHEDEAEAAAQTILKVMCTPPNWCKDLPLDAEAGFGKTYEFKKKLKPVKTP